MGTPRLDLGTLKVNGVYPRLERHVWTVRKGARWLDIAHDGRRYRYTSTGNHRSAELVRDGVRVAIGRGRHHADTGSTRAGKAEGPVDSTDLAIALVLDVVNTELLTLGGTLLSAPRRFLFETGAE
ncbi:hypothetical protein [Streptomyces sp. NPDC086787]|uniref:hypothetical protein n=1 Tax=Streptomyces sp. NPDC086787 TaxID=3365759 RepID=UPI00382D7FFB